MAIRVLIIDYHMGNLRSVSNAFASLGYEATISDRPAKLADAERLVLPGVGAFGDAMENLRQAGWLEPLEREVREKGKPFLGLCLGMQLLASVGTEHGSHRGLGWISGTVERITDDGSGVRVPHIGWNDVLIRRPQGLYAGLGNSATFYFVHSFVLRPDDPEVVSGVCDYGGEFAASVEVGNLYGTQFHPEKSQKSGLAVLQRFLELSKS